MALEGRGTPCGGPAVPPSLAARPVAGATLSTSPAAGSTERGTGPGEGGVPGRSSGGSGVIWSAGPAPGLPPSPVRSWPTVSGSCPHHCRAGLQDIQAHRSAEQISADATPRPAGRHGERAGGTGGRVGYFLSSPRTATRDAAGAGPNAVRYWPARLRHTVLFSRASGTTPPGPLRCPGAEDQPPQRLLRASGATSEALICAPPARRTAREAIGPSVIWFAAGSNWGLFSVDYLH